MSKVVTDDTHYKNIAATIREKAGTETAYKPEEMTGGLAEVYDAGHTQGYAAGYSRGYGIAQSLVDRSITSFSDDTMEALGASAFHLCAALESVELPNVTRIGASALSSCESLEHIHMENLATPGVEAFGNCTALTAVSFPKLTQTAQSLFRGDTALESADLPAVTKIADNCFYGCTALTTFPDKSLQNVMEVAQYGFYGCTALKQIVMSQCTRLNQRAFSDCSGLQFVDIANVTRADLVGSGYINTQAFYNCGSLMALIIRTPVMPLPLKSTAAFTGTPIAGGTGKIYVPSTLVNSYKNATNWSYYADRIFAIPSGM